jgi:hypothetical protein
MQLFPMLISRGLTIDGPAAIGEGVSWTIVQDQTTRRRLREMMMVDISSQPDGVIQSLDDKKESTRTFIEPDTRIKIFLIGLLLWRILC